MGWLSKAFGGLGFKSVTKFAQNVLGLDTGEDLAKQYDKQLKQQQEANKLNAANEAENVAKFDDSSGSSFGGTDNRQKKRGAGAYANALGLKI
jgi:hypothetical protein